MKLSDINQKIKQIKIQHKDYELKEENIKPDPFDQFIVWFSEIVESDMQHDPCAMVLATIDEEGLPDSRVVLLKELEKDKFIFFTHYQSKKAKQLAKNKVVAINFYWPEFGRQIRIKGRINKIDKHKSEAYFATRPRETQFNVYAWIQSSEIANRDVMEKSIARIKEQFADKPIPCPENWGGYAIVPFEYEFFQARKWRMHDRFRYTLAQGVWTRKRLAP